MTREPTEQATWFVFLIRGEDRLWRPHGGFHADAQAALDARDDYYLDTENDTPASGLCVIKLTENDCSAHAVRHPHLYAVKEA